MLSRPRDTLLARWRQFCHRAAEITGVYKRRLQAEISAVRNPTVRTEVAGKQSRLAKASER